jgi:hypothetical protein
MVFEQALGCDFVTLDQDPNRDGSQNNVSLDFTFRLCCNLNLNRRDSCKINKGISIRVMKWYPSLTNAGLLIFV